ncbi:MAG: polysulfide reductase NrfD, partial [Desulfobulbaceae bacterium]|nr:polysulfide reductase NrfD [Desulfobulbaceae bacterium]
MEELVVHGLEWTEKLHFVYPNEFIYWSIQIVMYPYMTGLVAGAFVLSSLYHVFGQKDLRDIAKFSLVFSLALLPVAMMPLQFHLQQPLRGIHVMMTPHFTSAIAAFGIVFSTYAVIVLSEIWFVYRAYFVEQSQALKGVKGAGFRRLVYSILTLGATDLSEGAIAADKKAVTVFAAIGIPVACFLHGYAGFIFGSVKANALWMSPLMPVIFIMSAVVSGIALCMFTYIVIMEGKKIAAS